MLKNQDCLKFLNNIKSESVDLVLTDPPYFIGFDAGEGWDSSWSSESEYLEWCKLWTEECFRVLKKDKMLCVFGTLKTDTFIKYKLNILNNIKEAKPQNEIIWSYNWGGRSKENFARKHEYIWCYSKGNDFLFNSDDILVERKQKINIRTGQPFDKGTIPTCVWEKNNHTKSKEYVNWHPTQKPIFILERIIKAYTNKNDKVLDIFSGSGSTMIACKSTDRNFLGCEYSKKYYEKSLRRFKSFFQKIDS